MMMMMTLLAIVLSLFAHVFVVNSYTYPPMTCGWTGYTHDFDGVEQHNFDYDFLSGQESVHSNNNEDRKYNWLYCHASGTSSNIQISGTDITLAETEEDSVWQRGCGGNTALKYIYSVHNNNNEDRRFTFKCSQVNNMYQLRECEWTNWVNDFDNTLHYQCNPNHLHGVLRSVESYHSNSNEDRRWKFECCRLTNSEIESEIVSMECNKPNYFENDFDGTLDILTSSYFFNGIESYHSNSKEDRKFKFRYCRPQQTSTYSHNGNIELLTQTHYDGEWTRSCIEYNNGNSGIVGIMSNHDNSKEDRQFTFKCGNLDMNYGLSNCGWTGHLANYDDANIFDCPGNGIIRSIWSMHSNEKEDRIFRFECCTVVSHKFGDKIYGKWDTIFSCIGCSELEYEIKVGVSNSHTETTSHEYRNSFGISITAGYTYTPSSASGGSGTSLEITVSSEHTWATMNLIENTLSYSQVLTERMFCPKAYLFQWVHEASDYLENAGTRQASVRSHNFLCTDNPQPQCPLGYCNDDDCTICGTYGQ